METKSGAAGSNVCDSCSEENERYSCVVCKRALQNSDVKFVMPASMYGSGAMPINRRVSCVKCFEGLKVRRKVSVHARMNRLRSIRRNLAGRMMANSRTIVNIQ